MQSGATASPRLFPVTDPLIEGLARDTTSQAIRTRPSRVDAPVVVAYAVTTDGRLYRGCSGVGSNGRTVACPEIKPIQTAMREAGSSGLNLSHLVFGTNVAGVPVTPCAPCRELLAAVAPDASVVFRHGADYVQTPARELWPFPNQRFVLNQAAPHKLPRYGPAGRSYLIDHTPASHRDFFRQVVLADVGARSVDPSQPTVTGVLTEQRAWLVCSSGRPTTLADAMSYAFGAKGRPRGVQAVAFFGHGETVSPGPADRALLAGIGFRGTVLFVHQGRVAAVRATDLLPLAPGLSLPAASRGEVGTVNT